MDRASFQTTTTITTMYSPLSAYPDTLFNPIHRRPPPVPSLKPEPPANLPRANPPKIHVRPAPLDFTLIHKLQSMPRSDIPILSLTPSPQMTEHPRRRSPLIKDDRSPARPTEKRTTTGSPYRALSSSGLLPTATPVRSMMNRLSTRLGLLADKDRAKAHRRVDKELWRLEKERKHQLAWDRAAQERKEIETMEDEDVLWQDVGLRAWSPLRVHQRSWRDLWGANRSGVPRRDGKKDPVAERRARRRKWLIIVLVVLVVAILVGLGILVDKLLSRHANSTNDTTSIQAVTTVIISGSSTYLSILTPTSTLVASRTSTSPSTTTSVSSSASPPATLAPVINLSTCLASFPPLNGTTYCSQCYPFLTTAPNDFSSTGGTSGVGNALQWCSLRAIYEATSKDTSGGQTTVLGGALNELGWFAVGGQSKNGSVYQGWDGVNCDEQGRLVQLNLTYPAVPDTIPSAIGNIVTLQTLSITGNTVASIPSGSLPTSIYELSNLTSLSLASTALDQPIPNTAFEKTGSLRSLTLLNNQGLGTALPTGLGGINLTALVVNGQALSTDQLSNLPSSLTYLDLSSNSLSIFPTSLSTNLPNLKTLLLSSNSLTSLPSAFPSSLRDLSLKGNGGLTGQLSSDLCGSTQLTVCDVSGTKLQGSVTTSSTMGNTTTTTTSCGVCQF